nr:putative ribonuclease H-like domain-containing protein [Tanacetum cinerariifolium]
MVAILEKSDAAGGFEQIIDFLSGSYINHVLTMNPHVYISCIKQFWNTAVVKRSGDVTRLQALVDKKRIVITKEVVREILQLNDAEGILLNSMEVLHSHDSTFLSAKRTSWNEFSSAMASALICLSSGQRFNFSKYIFESLVRNVDSSSKFYIRFLLIYEGLGKGEDIQEHAAEQVAADVVPPTPTSPSPSSLVEGLDNANVAQQLEIVKLKTRVKKLEKLNKVKSFKLRQLRKVGTSQHVKSSVDVENVFNQGRISVDMDQDEGIELVVDQEKDDEVLSMQEDDTEVQEAVEVVTIAKLITEVVTAATTQVVAASTPIPVAKPKTLTITTAPAVSTTRRKGVVIRDPEEELHTDTSTETPTVKDKGKGILIEDPKPMKKKDQVEMDAEYAKKLQEELDKEHEEAYKNIDWNASLDHVTLDESNLWHRRLGHVNFKTINKLVKGNLVRGLPFKVFTNENSCVACKKGKQHRASCKSKTVSSVDQPLFRLYMDLFGPNFVKSLSKKSCCLVITDDYSRFSWVFFLAYKDETASVLKTFIIGLENLLSLKGIKREFNVPRTPQQNGIAERKNRTLIEAAKTLLVDSLRPIPFWAEAVNTACYVQNRVLVTKPHNKTPYELLHCRLPSSGPAWLFDIDSLSQTMNYHPVLVENQSNSNTGFQDIEKVGEEGTQSYVLFLVLSDGSTNPKNNNKDALTDGKEHDDDIQKSVSLDIHSSSCGDQTRIQGDKAENKDKGESLVVTITRFRDLNEEFAECINNSSNEVNAVGSLISADGLNFTNSTNDFSAAGPSNAACQTWTIFFIMQMLLTRSMARGVRDQDDVGAEADINNLESTISVSHIPTSKIHKDHPTSQSIGDLSSTTQTKSMAKAIKDQGGLSQMFNEDFHTCMFACFLSQREPKRVHQAFKDPSWIEAMKEELLQFKLQKVWIVVDLPYGKRAIGTKWVYRNKKDERGIVVRNKERLVA